MKKYRILSHEEKTKLFELYKTGNYKFIELSKMFSISPQSIGGMLRRHGLVTKTKSELLRKYPLDENYFNIINNEEKAYFLGLLYADGCNNTKKGVVGLGLKESDKALLQQLNNLLQPAKPLQFCSKAYDRNKKGFENSQDQYSIIISSRINSNNLVELGVYQAKTFKLKFPTLQQVPEHLQSHFIRGYCDGDGYIGKAQVSFVSTKEFCESVERLLKEKLNINSYIRQKGIKNTYELSLNNKACRTFLKFIYNDAHIYLQRKYDKYILQMEYEKSLKELNYCTFEGCNEVVCGKGYCQYHYDKFCRDKKLRNLQQSIRRQNKKLIKSE